MRSQQPAGRDPPPPKIPATLSWGPPPGVSRRGAPAFSSSGIPEDVQLALEAIQNLVTYCPDWAKRVDELSGQIDQRQKDLAAAAERHNFEVSGERPRSSKSIKDRSSMESLKPKDDEDAHPGAGEPKSSAETNGVHKPERPSVSTDGITQDKQASTANTSPTSSDRAKTHVAAIASANARETLRKTEFDKKRVAVAESMLTGDGAAASKYRSRSLVIVYYDSYLQSFFEELVKFVSASRNLMRKAKMAAKVAQIKRMAELEMPDEDSGDEEEMELTANFVSRQQSSPTLKPEPEGKKADDANKTAAAYDGTSDIEMIDSGKVTEPVQLTVDLTPEESSPTGMLSTSFTANESSYSRSNGATYNIATPTRIASPLRSSVLFSSYGGSQHTQPDVFEELDKTLEIVQSLCERAAHQFLREGECAEDITKIIEKLTETKTISDGEMQKLLENDVDGALRKKLAEGPVRNRTYRPQSMRQSAAFAKVKPTMDNGKLISEDSTDGNPSLVTRLDTLPVTLGSPITLEVDECLGNGPMTSTESSRLQFRSTRAMCRQISTVR